jgi:hypothetical protein
MRMSAGLIFVLWKALLGFGLPIAVGLWELRNLRKFREQDAAELTRRGDGTAPALAPAEQFRKAA